MPGDLHNMEQAPKETARVLVVEDDLLIALDLSSIIENAGCIVLGPAPSVEEALSILAKAEPVAAFLDENLNGMSVAPVAHELDHRRIPFWILSGYAQSISSDPLLQKARRIRKPVSPQQIQEAITNYLSPAPR